MFQQSQYLEIMTIFTQPGQAGTKQKLITKTRNHEKKDDLNFVLSSFRIFVMKSASDGAIKCKKISTKCLINHSTSKLINEACIYNQSTISALTHRLHKIPHPRQHFGGVSV
jgi:hypothetical protein